MKLYLSSDLKIKDVKRRFEKEFPYLKIEFVSKSYMTKEGSIQNEILLPHNSLIRVSGVIRNGEITIMGNQTAAEIAQVFQTRFYLPVRIFRKTRSGWIEITSSNHFTMAKQNRMGRVACDAMYDEEVLL